MEIKNLILDIGNVICHWDAKKLVAGVFDDSSERVQAHTDTIGHPDWLDLDRGTLALENAIAAAQKRSSLDPVKIAQIYHNTAASLVPVQETVALIREMDARGVPLYVLSNMHDHCWRYLAETFDFWSCFKGVVVSCDAKLIKPDLAIYQHILQKYHLKPDETAFVDDMEENISGANNAGIQGVLLPKPQDGVHVINALMAK